MMFLFSVLFLTYKPPLNAEYKSTLNIPIIGKQHVHLHVKSRNLASLQLQGLIDFEDNFAYAAHPNGTLTFQLSRECQHFLTKYRCSVHNPFYDVDNDLASIVLRIRMLSFKKHILLYRV